MEYSVFSKNIEFLHICCAIVLKSCIEKSDSLIAFDGNIRFTMSEVYDPASDTWARLPDMPTPRCGMPLLDSVPLPSPPGFVLLCEVSTARAVLATQLQCPLVLLLFRVMQMHYLWKGGRPTVEEEENHGKSAMGVALPV